MCLLCAAKQVKTDAIIHVTYWKQQVKAYIRLKVPAVKKTTVKLQHTKRECNIVQKRESLKQSIYTFGKLLSISVIRSWLWRLALATFKSSASVPCIRRLSGVITAGTERRLSTEFVTHSDVSSVDWPGGRARLVRRHVTGTLAGDDEADDCCWSTPPTEDTSRCSGMDGGRTSVLGEVDVSGVEGDECEWKSLDEASDIDSDPEYMSEFWHKYTLTISHFIVWYHYSLCF